MPAVTRLVLTLVGAVVAGLTLAACGGDDGTLGTADPEAQRAPSNALEHVHGLGINPRDGALMIATHSGLFRAARGDPKAVAFGQSSQDVMGFSVLGPNRFIGSGHPAPQQSSLPPNLGLIESGDGGQTWQPVSLRGEADFHVLESSGRQVYGFDGTQGRLMVSRNGGRDWTQRTAPAVPIALAIDPTDPARTVASTSEGLYSSADAGRSWRRSRPGPPGLLAWPRADRLLLIDGQGRVHLSTDAGKRLRTVGSIGGQPAAFVAHADDLYAALADGTVQRSSDGGRSWRLRAAP